MSLQSILMSIEFASAELKRHAQANPGCLSEGEEWQLNIARKDLQDAAKAGGCIAEYQNGPERIEKAA